MIPRATTSRFRSSNFQFILAALESHFRTLNECLFILNNFQFIIIFYMNYDGILKCWGFALMCRNLEVWSHKGMLGSVVAVAFQITFRAEIHVNDVFLFFKNHFWYQHIKTMQNIQNILNLKKKLNFLEMRFARRFQTVLVAHFAFIPFFFMHFAFI